MEKQDYKREVNVFMGGKVKVTWNKGHGIFRGSRLGFSDMSLETKGSQFEFGCYNNSHEKSLISVFQEFSASINKIFILAGELHTSPIFPNFLRS